MKFKLETKKETENIIELNLKEKISGIFLQNKGENLLWFDNLNNELVLNKDVFKKLKIESVRFCFEHKNLLEKNENNNT